MTITLKAGSGNQPLPAGTYEASLARVEQVSSADGPYLKWVFSINYQGKTRDVTGVTPVNLEPGTKTQIWVEILLGRNLRDNEEVDLEKLCGRVCRIVLTEVTLQNGRQVNRIARVERRGGLVLQAGQNSSSASATPEEEDDLPF